MIGLAMVIAAIALAAVAGWFLHKTSTDPKPAAVLWICDQCGHLARAQPTVTGVLDLQALRKAHDCIGARELVSDVERYLIAQAPPI